MSRKRRKQGHGKVPIPSPASAGAEPDGDAEAQSEAEAEAGDAVPSLASGVSLKWIVAGTGVLLMAIFVAVIVYYDSGAQQYSKEAAARNRAVLAGDVASSRGNAQAKVHIVEFIDPACSTCAIFYPHVKRMMAVHPDSIRLSIRYATFHQGAEMLVKIVEAARNQDKYWQALEMVLDTQERWLVDRRVDPEKVWPALEGAGLDLERIKREMNAPEISQRLEDDAALAKAVGVTGTPKFYVNGHPLPRLVVKELQALVKRELQAS
jgi:protein-disulfide isomerase